MEETLRNQKTVAIIGGAGHVGLGMCLVLAHAGYRVFGIDLNDAVNQQIMRGEMPFLEEGAAPLLTEALERRQLFTGSAYWPVQEADIVIFVVGTPIDAHLNPDLRPLLSALQSAQPYFQKGQLIILRSTISPGTTERVRDILGEQSKQRVGEDVFLAFAPERIMQGKMIHELVHIPQLIGAFDDASYAKAEKFFQTFMKNRCFRLSPVEAEIGKLMTNMARYVQFALANEYYLIAESFDANIHRIIDACTYDYPRLHLPRPGPNVGGPCLHKDGFFLLERFPFPDLISVAFKINEGMPAQLLKKVEQYPTIKKVAILGMAFKANSDDIRNSLSFKMKRLLENGGYKVVCIDPHVNGCVGLEALQDVDSVILMAPHNEFRSLATILERIGNPQCVLIDIWGFWEEIKYQSQNGVCTTALAAKTLGLIT